MTPQTNVYISDLHFEHQQWIRELGFYQLEITILEARVAEISMRNSGTEVKKRIEQYQNQLIRQKEVIDELSHNIREHEDSLAQYAMAHPVAIEHVHFADHSSLREEMNTFRTIFNELKDNFYKFVVTWL